MSYDPQPIDPTELENLKQNGWQLSDTGNGIAKEFRFKNFQKAIAWMVQMSFKAEALNHHPEWQNVYSLVTVRLTTHDTGGLTDLDAKLARAMDASLATDQS